MWVVRNTFRVKYGCLQELVAFLKQVRSEAGTAAANVRICVPETGVLDAVALENEFETLDDLRRGMDNLWGGQDKLPKDPWLEKFDQLVVAGESQVWKKV